MNRSRWRSLAHIRKSARWSWRFRFSTERRTWSSLDLARSSLGQCQRLEVEGVVDVEDDDFLRRGQHGVVVGDVALKDHDVAPGLGLGQLSAPTAATTKRSS